MRNVTWKVKLNEDGQLIIVVPVSLLLATASLLLWGYLRMQNQEYFGARQSANVEIVVSSIANKLGTAIQGNLSSPACAPLSAAVANYQNLSYPVGNVNVAPIDAIYPRCGTGTISADFTKYFGGGCILNMSDFCTTPATPGLSPAIGDIEIKMTRLTPNLKTLTVGVALDIIAHSAPGTGPNATLAAAKSFTINHVYTLKASSLKDYVLVLRDWKTPLKNFLPTDSNSGLGHPTALIDISSAKPQIFLGPGVQVQFLSAVYQAENVDETQNKPVFLTNIFDPTSALRFEKPLHIRGKTVAIAGTTIDTNQLISVLKQGYLSGVFSSDTVPILPIEDWSNWDWAWEQVTDTLDLVDLSKYQQPAGLPLKATHAWMGGGNALPIEPPAAAEYSASDAQGLGISPMTVLLPLPGAVPRNDGTPLVSPMNYDAWDSVAAIQTACQLTGADSRFSTSTVTAVRMLDNIVVDYSLLPGTRSFCGLLAGDSVTLNLNPGTNYFYGNIIATRLSVTGPASSVLILINPNDGTPIPTSAGINSAWANAGMQTSAGSIGHNFFVPILNPVNKPAIVGGIDTSASQWAYRPHPPIMIDASNTKVDCQFTALGASQPGGAGNFSTSGIYYPNDIAQKAGFLCYCGTVNANTLALFCLVKPCNPTPVDNCAYLYSGAASCSPDSDLSGTQTLSNCQ